ncbi:hypothetical protein [Cytobacillus firmus]|uniref:hypothetical protein n=1 Tax=Cytobacillus firmus TaxID=1399 RepID=UPI001C8E9CBD|nr:hypothetical protein [Cytobacillus firmus]MBX9973988.1 hypothetical protein [Cytobacillus firmus]
MADLNHEVKKVLNAAWTKDSVFTEDEKQIVRNRIGTSAVKGRKKDYVPMLLSAAAAAGFVLLIGGIAGIQTDVFTKQNGQETVISDKDFYPGLTEGDMLNNWKLNGFEKDSYGHLSAVFTGKEEVTGTLDFREENVYFLPDRDSLKLLPLMDGKNIKMTFNETDQEMLKKVFGAAAPIKAEGVSIIIGGYRAAEGSVHLAEVLEVAAPKEPESKAVPFQLPLNNNAELVLREPLNHVYKEFSLRGTDEILRGLSPAEVFQLYLFAEEIEDYYTQYALFNHDPGIEKPFPTLNHYLNAISESPSIPEEQTLLHRVKNTRLEEVIIEDFSAYISISEEDGFGFGLSKNSEGIWKVNWMPIQ